MVKTAKLEKEGKKAVSCQEAKNNCVCLPKDPSFFPAAQRIAEICETQNIFRSQKVNKITPAILTMRKRNRFPDGLEEGEIKSCQD